jgi:hypothetical protein
MSFFVENVHVHADHVNVLCKLNSFVKLGI